MVHATASPYLWAAVAVGICGLCGSRAAGAVVVAAPKNGTTSRVVGPSGANGANLPPDGLETSQTRVDQVDGPPPLSDGRSGSANRISGKDYDGGFSVHNTYGPPRDHYHYYDERSPEYFGHPQVGHRPPSEAVYQQYAPAEHLQYVEHHGGEIRRPGELNIQPLLLPLAGVTLLGVLSALIKTPLLLHLGHVGRRRRDAATRADGRTMAEAIRSLLDQFDDQGRRRTNLQSCLMCDVVASTYNRKSSCAERSVCEVMSQKRPSKIESDRRLLTAMMAQVLENDQIPEEFRKRLELAQSKGRSAADCRKLYPCAIGEAFSGTEQE